MKLPFDVKCKNKTEIGYNKIVFNIVRYDNDPFNNAAYKLERRDLYFIINNMDTINLDKDTIKYYKNILNLTHPDLNQHVPTNNKLIIIFLHFLVKFFQLFFNIKISKNIFHIF